MKKVSYTVVTATGGLRELETKVAELASDGWKFVGGIAFNQGYPYQALARTIDVGSAHDSASVDDNRQSQPTRKLSANEAMKRLDELL